MSYRARRWKVEECEDCFSSAKSSTSPAISVAITSSGLGRRAQRRAELFESKVVLRLHVHIDMRWLSASCKLDEAENPIVRGSSAWYRRESKTIDRKSTRLNSSHRCISYAVFC